MRISAKATGLALLAAAYAVCAGAVFWRRQHRANPQKITIRFVHWQLESGVRKAMDAIVRRYEQLHPNVRVVQIAVPGGPIYISWVLTQMAGGIAPDLVEYSTLYPDADRFFEPLTAEVMQPNPYDRGTPMAGVPWRDTFSDALVSPDCYSIKLGSYFGIPLMTMSSRLVYNAPLLRKITGSEKPPATYRELMRTCDQINAYGAAHRRNLVPIADSHDTFIAITWIMQAAMGHNLTARIDYHRRMKIEPQELGEDYLRGDWSFDTPEMVALLQEMKEFGAMCTPGFWERERDTAVTDFVGGRSVMIVCPSWEASNLLGLCPFPIGAFSFPYPERDDPVYGRYSLGPYSDGQLAADMPFCLNRSTPHRAEALDFLRFMSSVEGDTIFSQVSNWPPAVRGVHPSAFAEKFMFNPNGYADFGNFLAPSVDADAMYFVQSRLASLWSAGGSVDHFRDVLRQGLGGAIRSDLTLDVESGLRNIRSHDVVAAAQFRLAPPGSAPAVLPLTAIDLQATIYQERAVLSGDMRDGTARPEHQSISGWSGSSRYASGSPRRSAAKTGVAPAVVLTPAWREIADTHADRALPLFERAAADPASAPEARFGEAVALLDSQPVTPENVDRARVLFQGLADGPPNPAAFGARFFLGRIAQFHQQSPDPAEAARQYLKLIAGAPESPWAQTALAPLALLEIYSLGADLPPAARIERSERLLAYARAPAAACQLHSTFAEAIFFYRLPPASALPHVLAALATGQLDTRARTEALMQAADLYRLAGDDAKAVEYYRIFLKENPIDYRCYAIRALLASIG